MKKSVKYISLSATIMAFTACGGGCNGYWEH